MRIITNLPADLLIPFFSIRFKGNVSLRRTEHGYIMDCEPTPTYLNWLSAGTSVVYYHDIPILIHPRSKL